MPDPSHPLTSKPIIWTISLTRLEQLFRDVAPEYDNRASVHNLHGGYEDAVGLLRKRLQRRPCDVIIAAGSNGNYIKKHVDKPVVLVEPTGFDLMQALNRARQRIQRPGQRIAVVTHQNELPTFVEFRDGFGLDIEHRSFQIAEDARACVVDLAKHNVGAVVGTGLVTEYAEQAGLAGILLYSQDSIRRAFNTALDMAHALEHRPTTTAKRPRRRDRNTRYTLDHVLGDSGVMQAIRQQIRSCADTDATLLIHGETGTGKELVAQAIHTASGRARQPFVAINCGAIAESLLESELFGYEEGAFTGARRGGRPGLIESANKGTLFLDEIGEMPVPLQSRLLRVLEEREVQRVGSNQPTALDLRILAASHCDLNAMLSTREFRTDLYYRLNVLRMELPALRERTEDLGPLLKFFIASRHSHTRVLIAQDALTLMQAYSWPGNLRELRNLAERITLTLSASRQNKPAINITVKMLSQMAPEIFAAQPAPSQAHRSDTEPLNERALLEATLRDTMGVRETAARRLGISRSTLWRRMRKYGL